MLRTSLARCQSLLSIHDQRDRRQSPVHHEPTHQEPADAAQIWLPQDSLDFVYSIFTTVTTFSLYFYIRVQSGFRERRRGRKLSANLTALSTERKREKGKKNRDEDKNEDHHILYYDVSDRK